MEKLPRGTPGRNMINDIVMWRENFSARVERKNSGGEIANSSATLFTAAFMPWLIINFITLESGAVKCFIQLFLPAPTIGQMLFMPAKKFIALQNAGGEFEVLQTTGSFLSWATGLVRCFAGRQSRITHGNIRSYCWCSTYSKGLIEAVEGNVLLGRVYFKIDTSFKLNTVNYLNNVFTYFYIYLFWRKNLKCKLD